MERVTGYDDRSITDERAEPLGNTYDEL